MLKTVNPSEMIGWVPPSSPIADARIFAGANGSVSFPIIERLPNTERVPKLTILISKELGRAINLMVENANNAFIYVLPNDDNTKVVMLKIRTSEILIHPGTYTVRVLNEAGEEILKKSLIVRNHPALL